MNDRLRALSKPVPLFLIAGGIGMVSMALQPVRGFTGLVIRSFEMEGRVRDVWVWYASILLAGLFTALFLSIPLWIFSLLRASKLHDVAIPSFVAGGLALLASSADPSTIGPRIGLFSLLFWLDFVFVLLPKTRRLATVAGFAIAAIALLRAIPELDNGGGYELIPALSYVISYMRFSWLSKTGPSRVLIVPFIFLCLACLAGGFAIRPGLDVYQRVVNLLGIATATTLLVCGWQIVQLPDGARQAMKCVPAAVFAGVIAFLVAPYFFYQADAGIEKATRNAWRAFAQFVPATPSHTYQGQPQ